jgi:hypothetical protein
LSEERLKIDNNSTGNAVSDMLRQEGYWCILVGAATVALQPDHYYRRRGRTLVSGGGEGEAR